MEKDRERERNEIDAASLEENKNNKMGEREKIKNK